MNTTGFSSHRRIWFWVTSRLVVFCQVHPRVQFSHLVAVAVEQDGRRNLEQSGQPDFLRLAPARMVDGRIDVGVEAVLAGLSALPAIERLLLGEPDLHDRLAVLEPVFP